MTTAAHLRITATGTLGTGGGVEAFQWSLNMAPEGGLVGFVFPEVEPGFDWFSDVAEDVRAFHADAAAKISSLAVLREVKFASIGDDGLYTEDAVVVPVTPSSGGSPEAGTTRTNLQDALAVTLETDRRGPTGRGRIFLPMPTIATTAATMLLDLADIEGVRDRTATLIESINNAPGLDLTTLQVVVASTKGYNTPVTGVSVGRVLDTIRSRRRSVPEARTAVQPVGGVAA